MTQPPAAPGTRGWRDATGPDPAYGHVPPRRQLPPRCPPSARRHTATGGQYSRPSWDAPTAALGCSTHHPGVQPPQQQGVGWGMLHSGDARMPAPEGDPWERCHHHCPRPREPSQQLEGTNSRMRATGRFLPARAQPDAHTPSPATRHPRSAPPAPWWVPPSPAPRRCPPPAGSGFYRDALGSRPLPARPRQDSPAQLAPPRPLSGDTVQEMSPPAGSGTEGRDGQHPAFPSGRSTGRSGAVPQLCPPVPCSRSWGSFLLCPPSTVTSCLQPPQQPPRASQQPGVEEPLLAGPSCGPQDSGVST